MRSRYHPIENGLWKDEKFDADVTKGLPDASFAERGFFAYVSSNDHQRSSGIYRASDEELAAGSKLSLADVQSYLHTLEIRGLIVRDGGWVFVPGYFKRQAKNPYVLCAVQNEVKSCSSRKVLSAFAKKFPLYIEYLPDGYETVSRPSDDGQQTGKADGSRREEKRREEKRRKELYRSASAPPRAPTNDFPKQARDVLMWLNAKAKRNFPANPTNLGFILARMQEGVSAEQLKAIVSRKVRQWVGDEKMALYLRPATLFNRTKCSQYLGELPAPQKVDDADPV